MTAAERTTRTQQADARCRAAFDAALGDGDPTGVALVAVGGYGRSELAPHSDLDLVLVHDGAVEVADLAGGVWYPLWDSGVRLDHSVRALQDVTASSADDVRVALGLLDARHVSGDTAVTLRLRSQVLAQWRRDARATLPLLRRMTRERAEQRGELAHAAVPDLKESSGGLRDATVLSALVATWLVDVPHTDLERCRRQLLDVRDVLQDAAGRATDRVTPEVWGALAEGLGLPDEEAAQRHLRALGRRTTHLSRLTWSRVDHVLAAAAEPRRRRTPQLTTLAPGVAVSGGEVVLDRGAEPARDPMLVLRAAAVAAERGLMLAPATAARLAADSAPLPDPWTEEARGWFVRLLAAGSGLLAVWETLDETGALSLVLPEWERIRLLPHASTVHRFTVDRHVVETCVEASALIRRVARPDLLCVAAVLHDIGKGGLQDHSIAGEPVAAAVARRMGFASDDVLTVARLVRWHLLLAETATTRDPSDPSTAEHVAARVGDVATLDLLETLTEADARATSAKAWTRWRASLVAELAGRTRTLLQDGAGEAPLPTPPGDAPVDAPAGTGGAVEVRVEPRPEGSRLTVAATDRVGLMADVAGALSLLRIPVRAARAWTDGDRAVSVWEVAETEVDDALVRQRLHAVTAGTVDPAERLPAVRRGLPPVVTLRHEASREATVLEVRTDDRPGVVHLVCRALARLDLSVRSAHVATLGPQVLDVFYVQETGAGALGDERAAAAAHAVRAALEGAATLDA